MWVARTATLILLLVAGCTTPAAEPTPSDSPAAPATTAAPQSPATVNLTITIRKTGGIAGVNDTLVVDAKGNWTRTTKSGTKTGQLTPEQLAQAAKLATDPRLIAEAQTPQPSTNCADAFVYAVSIGTATVTYSDCGSGSSPPATTALVRYLDQVTGG
ncbi:MAG TPA: hypothetical protein VFC19_10290 [Candidatus Limnocylindrales bacterium]|nr:hypothetical protein [Candidatus Limnocylindrales bacterium]